MQKLYEAICWITVGFLGLFAIAWLLTRGLGSVIRIAWLFISSPLTWWFKAPAAILVFAGLAYLLTRMRRRIPPNKKFLD